MLWYEKIERVNRKEESYTYSCEDFFGSLTIVSSEKLDPSILDILQLNITRGGSGENTIEVKRRGGIIKVSYKFIKNTKSLWEKSSPEELSEN